MLTARKLDPGMGKAVFERTIERNKEIWLQTSRRVSFGNALLHPSGLRDYDPLQRHIANRSIIPSGRHLQHGDYQQPERNLELFSNCSTAAASFILFYLLLNGSGVGRDYSDNQMLVDWSYMPDVRVVLSKDHPDFTNTIGFESAEDARMDYPDAIWHTVGDSREGWALGAMQLEVMAYQKIHRDKILVLDFSNVREKDRAIQGMQGRPASGPIPMMTALKNVAHVKYMGFRPWKQTMYVDHYLAECVLVGGARRAARIATKYWKDSDILEFIAIKQNGALWSANNSIAVDDDFYTKAKSNLFGHHDAFKKAKLVFTGIVTAQYEHKTGEPGILNTHMLEVELEGLEAYKSGDFLNSSRLNVSDDAKKMLSDIIAAVLLHAYQFIVNPCGEIVLFIGGGYCIVSDWVPYHCPSREEEEEAIRLLVRFLIRTNLMDSLYKYETKRTNRIGISIIGVHEYAWKYFGFGFRDLIDENKSAIFWEHVSWWKSVVNDEAKSYSAELDVAEPHTNTTMKPGGTTAKLDGLTECANLPSMREYLRWVQFKNGNPLIEKYKSLGYPWRALTTYENHTIIGFPTQPEMCRIGMPDDMIVTAAEATPEEQFQWLRNLEKYWIAEKGNQVSYTLKYYPDRVSFEDFSRIMLDNFPTIKACSVMPQISDTKYEYQPEEPISRERYEELVANIIDPEFIQILDERALLCSNGACPL